MYVSVIGKSRPARRLRTINTLEKRTLWGSAMVAGQERGNTMIRFAAPIAFGVSLVFATSLGLGTAYALPDASQAEERAMVKGKIGKQIDLDTPTGRVSATVKSIEFADYKGWPEGSGRIALALVVRNFSPTSENGIQVGLRCGSSTDEGGHYADSTVDAQYLPSRTQESGVLIMGMPKATVDKGRECTNARVVIRPSIAYGYSDGFKRFAALIRVPNHVAAKLK